MPPFFTMSYNRVHTTRNQAKNSGSMQGLKMDHRLDPDTKKFISRSVYILAGALVLSSLIKTFNQ